MSHTANTYVERNAAKLKRIQTAITKQVEFRLKPLDLSVISTTILRMQHALPKVASISTASDQAHVTGHALRGDDMIEQIFDMHPAMVKASPEDRTACKKAVPSITKLWMSPDGHVSEAALDLVDGYKIPETDARAKQRAAGQKVKTDLMSVSRWRFTLLFHDVVVKKLAEMRASKIADEAVADARRAIAAQRAQYLDLWRGEGVAGRHEDKPGAARAALYGYTDAQTNQMCTHCRGSLRLWVAWDLGNGNSSTQKWKSAKACPVALLEWLRKQGASSADSFPETLYCPLQACTEKRKHESLHRKKFINQLNAQRKCASYMAANERKEAAAKRKREKEEAQTAKAAAAMKAKKAKSVKKPPSNLPAAKERKRSPSIDQVESDDPAPKSQNGRSQRKKRLKRY